MHLHTTRAVVAGAAGTAAMTAMTMMAPLMGLPPMNPAQMLARAMHAPIAVGWLAHFMVGITLALGYAAFGAARLPGPPAARGAAFAVAPWLFAQAVMMPMMGAPLFSGSAMVAMASLVGHLLFGGVVGAVYGRAEIAHEPPQHPLHA